MLKDFETTHCVVITSAGRIAVFTSDYLQGGAFACLVDAPLSVTANEHAERERNLAAFLEVALSWSGPVREVPLSRLYGLTRRGGYVDYYEGDEGYGRGGGIAWSIPEGEGDAVLLVAGVRIPIGLRLLRALLERLPAGDPVARVFVMPGDGGAVPHDALVIDTTFPSGQRVISCQARLRDTKSAEVEL